MGGLRKEDIYKGGKNSIDARSTIGLLAVQKERLWVRGQRGVFMPRAWGFTCWLMLPGHAAGVDGLAGAVWWLLPKAGRGCRCCLPCCAPAGWRGGRRGLWEANEGRGSGVETGRGQVAVKEPMGRTVGATCGDEGVCC